MQACLSSPEHQAAMAAFRAKQTAKSKAPSNGSPGRQT